MTDSAYPDDGAEPAHSVRALLFDFDGTLLNTIPLILASFRHATAVVLGTPLSDEVLLRDVGVPLVRQMHDISPEHTEELVRVYREHNFEYHDEMALEYPGTEQALESLRERGFPMGVVSSKTGPGLKRGLELYGLDRFFDVVVGCDDTERHKPDPEPLRYAAELLGVPLEHCAYIGDSEHDMAAAVRGGAVAIAALWGPFEPERVLGPGPDYALRSILELPELLDGDGSRFRVGAAFPG